MSQTSLSGMGVSPGIAIGKPVIHESLPISTVRIGLSAGEDEAEVERLRRAVATAVEGMRENQQRASRQMGAEYAGIFEAHQLIASDPSFLEPIEKIIRTQLVNAEWALDQVVATFVERFEALPDAHLAERKLDVLDVATQILKALHGFDLGELQALDHPVILVASDLAPSTTVQLPLDKILGFVLEGGGPTAHTTIIARSLGIPVVVGAHGVCQLAQHAQQVAVDAFEGRIVFDPNPAEISEFESRQREHREQQAQLLQMRTMPTVTRDGHALELMANIDLLDEVATAVNWNVVGIGLYRSEFLYMKLSPNLPSEADHLAVYRELVEGMDGRPVTIRTFDLGGKKLAREVIGTTEANPVLGLRGIRLCFSQPEFFRTQLRALLRLAGEYPAGRVRIMFPLISGIEEFRVARLLVRRLRSELAQEGCAVPDEVPLGAMVEVPASAVMAEDLAREADFLSIGTNDLIQYSLAVDRSNEQVAHLYRPTSPAVLRMIAGIRTAADAIGVPVTICGEMAADPLMVPLLVGLGLRSLSMNPQAVPVVRALIRQLSYRESVHMARQALAMVTAREVEEFLLERLAIVLAKAKIRV
jgi:phosphotransferase system enzyme I (PtsI)